MDDLICVDCNQPIGDADYCWPCWYAQFFASERPKNYPCSLCGVDKDNRDRYCKRCETTLYPSQQEIETVLVEIRSWIR